MQKLFGGALEISLPNGAIDASTVRQIPDNQEVFIFRDSDDSWVIEILEEQPNELSAQIRKHFEALGDDNEAQEVLVNLVESPFHNKIMLAGIQKIKKFNSNQVDIVNIALGLYRISEYQAEILVTCNSLFSVDLESFRMNLDSLKLIDASIFL